MCRFLKNLVCNQAGQVLPIVLILMVFGGLVIAPSINYTAGGMNAIYFVDRGIKGLYAADAGVEYVLWSLIKGNPPPLQLADNPNQMDVSLQTVNIGSYALYFGEFLVTPEHNDYLAITEEIVPDAGDYKYTITVTWQPGSGSPVIYLEQVGARLPQGYSYLAGSAAGFSQNLDTSDPTQIQQDVFGAYMINWQLDQPYPSLRSSDPVKTQTFRIAGSGSQEGTYAWVVANREDIGAVGFTGDVYRITSTAISTESGQMAAIITSDVIVQGGTLYIISWQVLK